MIVLLNLNELLFFNHFPVQFVVLCQFLSSFIPSIAVIGTLQLLPMSSISSGVDITVKYQRLAVEYVKVRNQVSVLKSALLEEQSKSADLADGIAQRESRLFKLEGERDSLLFRNEQLLKRVESLQESMDTQQAMFGMAKGKKKHKEANLRLVAESSRMHRQALGGPSSSDPLSVLEGELERKITENSELHSKLFDVERRSDETITSFIRRIDELEKQNEALRSANSLASDALQSKQFGICDSTNDAAGQRPLTEENGKGTTLSVFGVNDALCTSNNFANASAVSQSSRDQTIDNSGPAADSAHSSSSETRTNDDVSAGDDAAQLDKYSLERMSVLSKSLQHATGRATYYKQECEELLRKAICDQQSIEALELNNCELTSKCHSLTDVLETTQHNYESQLRELHEHLAEKEEQNDRILSCNGTAASSGGPPEMTKGHNGMAKKNEKFRSNWFSSSMSSKQKE